ncbi:MAG TPA: hypothetical protein VHU19_13575 [Pyrinomonadaceae bacterium]|jgi:hypothetical protein|nr:hypothetical protein [Pyrinomonadaceae bacterium]
MKRTFYTIVTMLLLAVLNATAKAQDTQETLPDPCEKKTGCVKVDYDRFKDKTRVAMTPVLLLPDNGYGNPLEGVQMGVVYFSPGKVILRPDKVTFFFAAQDTSNAGYEPSAFHKSRDVDLLIDGVSRPLGAVDVVGRKLNDFDLFYPTWTYTLEVPFDVVEKMAAAKRVEIRAGSVETFLDDDTRAAFRRLVELMPKKESPAPAKAAPHPQPTRTPRRRSRP